MRIRLGRCPLITLGLLSLILTGCAGSPSSMFYQLSSLQDRTSVSRDVVPEKTPIVAIGPVRIPDYLDRPQIVTRSGKNELMLSEFDRWAGPFESDITRVLVENISSLLPVEHFSVIRWIPYMESQMPASYRVHVLVDRFEGTPGDSVLLTAQWRVFAADGSLLLRRESRISGQINGSSYASLVATMSDALAKLSQEIAGGITSVGLKHRPLAH